MGFLWLPLITLITLPPLACWLANAMHIWIPAKKAF
jgi:hypothetical protein